MLVDFMGTNQKQQQQQQMYPRPFMPALNVPNSQYLTQTLSILGQPSFTQFPVEQRQQMPNHEAPNSLARGATQVSDPGPTTSSKEMGDEAETRTPKTFVLMGVEQSV